VPATEAEAGAHALHGDLHLRFAVDEGGRTTLVESRRTPPMHLQRLLYLDARHPALAQAALLNTTAGLFSGDRLDLEVRMEAGAAVALTTPAMTRAYAMPEGHAEVTTHLSVAWGAHLELLPEPLLLCRDADLVQRTVVDVIPGASVALGEVVALGRRAHGEAHAYRRLEQRTVLRRAGQTILADGLLLTPPLHPDAPGVLGDHAAYGSLYLLPGESDSHELLAETRALLATAPAVLSGASLLPASAGVTVRALGPAPNAVQRLFRSIVDAFRGRCCLEGRPAQPSAEQAAITV
jgi:urease accessory protein